MSEAQQPSDSRAEAARRAEVHTGSEYVAFAELTRPQVKARAESIAAAGGWGPLARAAKVARAWAALGALMDEHGAAAVGELPDADVVRFAEHTWALPPEGGLI